MTKQAAMPFTELAKPQEPNVMTNTLQESNGTALVSLPTDPLAIIARAVDNGMEPDKLGKLMELQERWQRNEDAKAFAVSLSTFQAKCPQITKRRTMDLGGGKGPTYASLDDIMREVSGLLQECGLAVTFSASITDGGMMKAVCKLHCGSHVQESEITLPVPSAMRVNDTQKMGAALSYAKRYALCAALNIVVTDEDNDGANLAASGEMELVTGAQAAELADMIKAKKLSLEKLCEWAGVTTLDDLSVAKYREMKTRINGVKK